MRVLRQALDSGAEPDIDAGEIPYIEAIVPMSGFSAELIEADRDSPLGWELLRKPCSREELTQAIARVVAAP